MNAATVVVGLILLAVVGLIVAKLIRDKRKGKVCGCDCGGCAAGCGDEDDGK